MNGYSIDGYDIFIVKSAERIRQDERTSDVLIRLCLESIVNAGQWTHLMYQIHHSRLITNFLTSVSRQQKITAAILIRSGPKESGATQWILACLENLVMFPNVVSRYMLLNRGLHDSASCCKEDDVSQWKIRPFLATCAKIAQLIVKICRGDYVVYRIPCRYHKSMLKLHLFSPHARLLRTEVIYCASWNCPPPYKPLHSLQVCGISSSAFGPTLGLYSRKGGSRN